MDDLPLPLGPMIIKFLEISSDVPIIIRRPCSNKLNLDFNFFLEVLSLLSLSSIISEGFSCEVISFCGFSSFGNDAIQIFNFFIFN